jgi:hypothetical protein
MVTAFDVLVQLLATLSNDFCLTLDCVDVPLLVTKCHISSPFLSVDWYARARHSLPGG